MGSRLMFHFIFLVSCCLKFKVQWRESWKHDQFMWMFSMCKDIICELLMCKVFFLFIVWNFLCEPLCVQNSMHDFFGINTKWSFKKTTQSWWKQPYIQSGLRLRGIKKKVVEHCCRNCPFWEGVSVGMAYDWQLWHLCHKGPTFSPPQTRGIFHIWTKLKYLYRLGSWKSFGSS